MSFGFATIIALGRKEALEPFLHELHARPLLGTAAELVSESRRGLANMQNAPDIAFRCGPFALAHILQHGTTKPRAEQLRVLYGAKSTPRGLSLSAVERISAQAGMRYQMAFREPGAELIVPAVAHWKVGHFAALTAREGTRYRVADATFGEDILMSALTLEEESSGYFLVPAGSLPIGWRAVGRHEADHVWGRGDTGANKDNGATGAGEQGAFPAGQCALGCSRWNVEPMVVGLSLHDVPVGYTPALGPAMLFELHYSHRDVQQPQIFDHANLGRKWTTTWLSYVTDNVNVNGSVELYRRGGGNETFTFAAAALRSNLGPFSSSVMIRRTDGVGNTTGYSREFSDGSIEDFSHAMGSKYFLTALIDPHGNRVSLAYDTQLRLVTLTDALGLVTTISYELAGDPLKMTKVTDPFGRTATFSYDAANNLESITDSLGIVSKFSYGPSDFISKLETPYGTTTFSYGDASTDASLGTARVVNATDALGRTSRVEFRHAAPGISASTPAGRVPKGMSTTNDHLQWRNTFVWSAEQYARAQQGGQLDYTAAKIIHWLHTQDNSTARVIESVKEPMEERVWYDYPSQPDSVHVGTASQPLHIGRVLDDGTTQLTSFEYNARGRVSKKIDPAGRTFQYEYTDAGLDLLAVYNVTDGARDQLLARSYDDKRRLLSSSGADGVATHYEYTSRGQLAKLTDALGHVTTYEYDPRGYLVAIVKDTGARRSFERDAVGRASSTTSADGMTVRYEYDAADRRTKTEYPNGTSLELEYRWLDLARIKDRSGHVTELTIDAERQLTAVRDPMGQVMAFEYGADGKLSSFTDEMGSQTRVERDLQGRVTSKHYPDGGSEAVEYERASSRVHALTDASSQVTSYRYLIDDALAEVNYASAQQSKATVRFDYDHSYRRVVSMTDATGQTTYTYHPMSPPAPGAGSLASAEVPVAGAPGVKDTIKYSYDSLGRVVAHSIGDSSESLTYDSLGRLAEVHNELDAFLLQHSGTGRDVSSATSEHGPQFTHRYHDSLLDNLLRETDVVRTSGQPLAHFEYDYDPAGNVRSFVEDYLGQQSPQAGTLSPPAMRRPDGGTDGPIAGRYVAMAMGLAVALLLCLAVARGRADARLLLGLLPLLTSTFCTAAQLGKTPKTASRTDYHYDDNYRLLSASVATSGGALAQPKFEYQYDAVSNITSRRSGPEVHGFSYTSANAIMAGRYDANGSPSELDGKRYAWDAANRLVQANSSVVTTEFSYDGLHRMVRAVETRAGKVVRDRAYVWCGDTRCAEHDNLKPGSPISKRYFEQGFVADGERFYYVTDRLGSVRQLIDAAGRVRAQYTYDPYGVSTKTHGDKDSDVGFAGYFRHATSGLQFARYRAYDAAHGRWLNRDPIGYRGGQPNLYAYAGGDPINRTDPFGLAVYWCRQEADLPLNQYVGLEHWWLMTDKHEYGLGVCGQGVPGVGGNSDAPFSAVCLNDHTGRSLTTGAHCEVVEGVDEGCVDKTYENGGSFGRWIPALNDCQTTVNRILYFCSDGQQGGYWGGVF